MLRQIIHIDEDKCNGCGICVDACHEGAIALEGGKAKLVKDDYCDGMGDCLPECPTGAIAFETREAAAYDEAAVEARKAALAAAKQAHPGGCPSAQARAFDRPAAPQDAGAPEPSQLTNWPVQIKLAPTWAPYFDGADLLVAADCTAFAYASFHRDYMAGKVTLIGCPKLDAVDYAEKLAVILQMNDTKSVLMARMVVPCCGGLEMAVRRAIEASGKDIPLEVVTFSLDGKLLD